MKQLRRPLVPASHRSGGGKSSLRLLDDLLILLGDRAPITSTASSTSSTAATAPSSQLSAPRFSVQSASPPPPPSTSRRPHDPGSGLGGGAAGPTAGESTTRHRSPPADSGDGAYRVGVRRRWWGSGNPSKLGNRVTATESLKQQKEAFAAKPFRRSPPLIHSMEKSRSSKDPVGAYAVQCGECSKWRLIPSKDEYETIRENFIEDPYVCNKNPEVSCDDPADIEYDTSRLWVIDKPNIPKTPPSTERYLTLRKDLSKMDVQYMMPNGKKMRSTTEVERFLEAYPEWKEKFSASNFMFTPPKIMEDMVPGRSSAGSNKRSRK